MKVRLKEVRLILNAVVCLLLATLSIVAGGVSAGQNMQPQMEALALKLDLGDKRYDSERPQPTESVSIPEIRPIEN